MLPRKRSTTLLFVAVILLVGLLAGCGGGDQSGNGSQDGESGGGGQGQVGKAVKKEGAQAAKRGALRPKIALGTVIRVKPERRKMIIRPTTAEGDPKPMPFKIGKQGTITLDDEDAEVADIQKGQQAQITYIVRGKVNLAREVTLISGEGAAPGAGENIG